VRPTRKHKKYSYFIHIFSPLRFFFFFNNFINHNCTIKTTTDFDCKYKFECKEFRPVSSLLLLNLVSRPHSLLSRLGDAVVRDFGQVDLGVD
jgi:hypothetical protein